LLAIYDADGNAKLVFVQKLHLFLEKSTKTAANRAALIDSNICTKSFVAASPQTTLGILQRFQTPSCI